MTDYALYSFDIFDTVITRKVAQPRGIFAIMQYELCNNEKFKDFPQEVKVNFFKHRTNAEYRQRKLNYLAKDDKDITFDQIYQDIKENCYLSDAQIEQLKDLELQTEFDNILPIEENVQKINELINQGKHIVLISDMYLPEDFIRKLLTKTQLPNDIKIYLSSVVGFKKETGEMYSYVQKQENVAFDDWYHLGDNEYADYKQALYAGINSELYHYVELKTYEDNILRGQFDSPFVQLMIGCAKNLRLQNYKKSDKFDLGVSLAGPIFYPYVSWLIEQAQKRGIKHLYFLARDGYILQKIADIIIKEQNLNLKTQYVYGSKKAWRLPSLTLENKTLKTQFVETLCWTPKKLDKLLGLTRKELCEILPKEFHCYNHTMSERRTNKLKKFLNNNDRWLKLVIECNSAKREIAKRYLKQLSDEANGERFAFVDVDGTRFTMNCMSSIMREVYHGELNAFYLTSTPTVFAPIEINYYHFYALKKSLVGHVMELLARAPHGQTLGYEEKDGRMVPILEQTSPKIFEDWKFDEYINGIEEFAKACLEYKQNFPEIVVENQQIMERYIYFMARDVDRDTANLLGNIVHSLYGTEKQEFAPKIGVFAALKYLITNKIASENVLYSKVRSNCFIQKILEYRMAHPDLRKEMINLFIHKRRRQATLTLLGTNFEFGEIFFPKKSKNN